MASRKTLLSRVMAAIKAGDRRPEVLALAYKIKHAPREIVHGYSHSVRYLLG